MLWNKQDTKVSHTSIWITSVRKRTKNERCVWCGLQGCCNFLFTKITSPYKLIIRLNIDTNSAGISIQ